MTINEILENHVAEIDQFFEGEPDFINAIKMEDFPALENSINALIEERAKGFAEWVSASRFYVKDRRKWFAYDEEDIQLKKSDELYALYLDSLTNKTKEA